MSNEIDGIKQVDKEELKQILNTKDNNQVIIDVREPDEYEDGHIPGIPLVPMHTIPGLADAFRKDKEYIFVCRSGNRSQNVSLFLKDRGINAVNFEGGMLDWDGGISSGEEVYIKNKEDLEKFNK